MIHGQEFHPIIQNIFGEDVKGLNISSQLQCNCPNCARINGTKDDKYNLELNTQNRKYHCWSCSISGSLGKLIRIYGKSSDYEMFKALAGTFSDYIYNEDNEEIEYVPVKLPDEMIYFSDMDVTNSSHFEAYNYLINDRKINREIILKYHMGFCLTGKYATRIIIPSINQSDNIDYFVARSYNKKEKKYKYLNPPVDKEDFIFNSGSIDYDSTIYLVEGVFDAISLPNAIPMLGKKISTKLFAKLSELKSNLIILLDPDAKKDSLDLLMMLKNIYVGDEEKVRMVILPNNLDVDEIRRNNGIDSVIECLYTARGLTVDDYFMKKLEKPYVKYERNRRYETNSRYSDWKSGSSRNFI